MKIQRLMVLTFAVVAPAVVPVLAFADTTFDTTTVLAAITAAATAVGAVGAAIFAGPLIVVAGWRWLRRAL